jgi:hypothetical protein
MTLAPFNLRTRLRLSRQWWRNRQPEVDELRKCLDPIATSRSSRRTCRDRRSSQRVKACLNPVDTIRRQERRDRSLDNGGAEDFLAVRKIDQLPQDFRRKIHIHSHSHPTTSQCNAIIRVDARSGASQWFARHFDQVCHR